MLSCTTSAADVATTPSPENLVKQVLTSLETTDEPGLKRLLICALPFPFKPAPSFRLTSCAGLRVE